MCAPKTKARRASACVRCRYDATFQHSFNITHFQSKLLTASELGRERRTARALALNKSGIDRVFVKRQENLMFVVHGRTLQHIAAWGSETQDVFSGDPLRTAQGMSQNHEKKDGMLLK